MGKCILQKADHQDRDANLQALPAICVLLSAAEQCLIHVYDENGNEMFALSDSEGVSHTQSVDPDQSRTATLFEKLEGTIRKETECISEMMRSECTAETNRATSRSIIKELEMFESTGEKTANITKITAASESTPPTSVKAERAFLAVGLFIT